MFFPAWLANGQIVSQYNLAVSNKGLRSITRVSVDIDFATVINSWNIAPNNKVWDLALWNGELRAYTC